MTLAELSWRLRWFRTKDRVTSVYCRLACVWDWAGSAVGLGSSARGVGRGLGDAHGSTPRFGTSVPRDGLGRGDGAGRYGTLSKTVVLIVM